MVPDQALADSQYGILLEEAGAQSMPAARFRKISAACEEIREELKQISDTDTYLDVKAHIWLERPYYAAVHAAQALREVPYLPSTPEAKRRLDQLENDGRIDKDEALAPTAKLALENLNKQALGIMSDWMQFLGVTSASRDSRLTGKVMRNFIYAFRHGNGAVDYERLVETMTSAIISMQSCDNNTDGIRTPTAHMYNAAQGAWAEYNKLSQRDLFLEDFLIRNGLRNRDPAYMPPSRSQLKKYCELTIPPGTSWEKLLEAEQAVKDRPLGVSATKPGKPRHRPEQLVLV